MAALWPALTMPLPEVYRPPTNHSNVSGSVSNPTQLSRIPVYRYEVKPQFTVLA